MTTHAEIGMNRTGIASSPRLSAEMVKGMDEFSPAIDEDAANAAVVRKNYAKNADPIGHVPPPLSVKGMAKSAVQALKGEAPSVLIDKLGERLGFERSGVRLYEGIVSKFDAFGGFAGGPTRAELQEILNEEFAHFALLQEPATALGADPTVLTPSADLHATMSRGILDVVADARTTLPQCLEAALLAELADNDCWRALVDLAEQAGDKPLANRFIEALLEEDKHLSLVRTWVAAAQGRNA